MSSLLTGPASRPQVRRDLASPSRSGRWTQRSLRSSRNILSSLCSLVPLNGWRGVSWATTTNCGQVAAFSATPDVRVLGAVGEDIGDTSDAGEEDARGISSVEGMDVSKELVGVRGAAVEGMDVSKELVGVRGAAVFVA